MEMTVEVPPMKKKKEEEGGSTGHLEPGWRIEGRCGQETSVEVVVGVDVRAVWVRLPTTPCSWMTESETPASFRAVVPPQRKEWPA
jgi:hypothetical protein